MGMRWDTPRRPPKRRCHDCGGDVYSWAEWVLCRRCSAARAMRAAGDPVYVEPDGPAAEARRRRLERFRMQESEQPGGPCDA